MPSPSPSSETGLSLLEASTDPFPPALSLAKAPPYSPSPKRSQRTGNPSVKSVPVSLQGQSRVVKPGKKVREARSGTELKGNGTEISSGLARAAETHPL